MKTTFCLIALASSIVLEVAAKHQNFANEHVQPYRRSTRHVKRARSCRAASTVKQVSVTKSNNSTTTKSSGKTSASDDPFKRSGYLSINGVGIGFLPDNGDSGGSVQDINELNSYIGHKSFSVGLYAHIQAGVPFTGAELFDLGASQLQGKSGLDPGSVDSSSVVYKKDAVFKSVVKSGAVFIASVMPTSWDGLTADNNTQAIRIAKVMKRFTDAGVVSWLRFAHEANWYNSDGCTEGPNGGKIYPGSPQDVKDAWAVMAAARDKYAPLVKMYWSPNTGSQSEIESYAPEDVSTIDVVGVDWYPNSPTADLVSQYKWMHDKYASATVPFTIGETGQTTSIDQRQLLLKTWTSKGVTSALPNFRNINWFSYNKGADFMLGGKACGDCDKQQVRSFFDGLADKS